jgi:hypothetical protein
MDKKAIDDTWEILSKNYEFIRCTHVKQLYYTNGLSESKEPLTTIQISEKIAVNSKGKLINVSGALKDSLEE